MPDGLPDISGNALTPAGTIRSAGQHEARVASVFDRVANVANQIAVLTGQADAKKGEKEALRDFNERAQFADDIGAPGLGNFTKRERALGLQTAGDRAYNNMLETLYLQRTKGSIEQEAARLRADPNTFGNVEQFDVQMEEVKKSIGGNTDPDFADEVFFMMDTVQQDVRGKVAADRQAADMKEAREAMDATIQGMSDDLDAILRSRGQEALADPEVKRLSNDLQRQMQIKADNPVYGYSEEQRALDADVIASRLEVATLLPDIESVFEEQGYAAALETADTYADGLQRTTAERERTRNALRQEINLLQQNRSAHLAEVTAEEARQKKVREDLAEVYDKRAIDIIFSPTATKQEKHTAVLAARPYVTETRYSTLLGKVFDDSAGKGVGDSEFTQYRIMARNNALDEDQVLELVQFTDSQRNTLLADIDKTASKVRKPGVDRIEAAFKDGGMLDTSAETAQQRATQKVQAIEQLDDWFEGLEHTPNAREVQDQVDVILSTSGRVNALVERSSFLSVGSFGSVPGAEDIADAKRRINERYKQIRPNENDMRGLSAYQEQELERLAEERALLNQIEGSINNAR
jgi:hypothetical protein